MRVNQCVTMINGDMLKIVTKRIVKLLKMEQF